MANKKEWSNELGGETVPESFDREQQRMTPREVKVAALGEKYKDAQPQICDITNKNAKSMRVIYDYYGQSVAVPPTETKLGIALHPGTIDYFKGGKNDLEVRPAA